MNADPVTVNLHYDVAGRGSPMVLSHGVIENSVSWDDVVPALAPRHRVVTYDARGRGRSVGGTGPFGHADLAADVEGLATRLGLARFYHAGHSMGARVALEHALAYPSRVAGLAIISGRAGKPDAAGRARLAELAARVRRKGPATAVGLWARLDEPVYPRARRIAATNPADGTATALQALSEMDDLLPRLGQIRVPALVVVGGGDQSYLASARAITEALPNATLRVLKGVGHFPNLECPVLLARLLTEHAVGCR